MPYFAANACRKRWSSGFLKSSWMMLWSTYWTARGTCTRSTPIRSNCRQAMVPVASCSSVWSILSAPSSPGSGEPLIMWSLRILVTRFSAIAHHPRQTCTPLFYTAAGGRLLRNKGNEGWRLLAAHEPLVDRAVPADCLTHLLRGLLPRAPLGCRARDGVGADATGLPVVVGDVGVHDAEATLGLLIALRGVGDEVALFEDLGDGTVGQLDRTSRVVHEDPLDLLPPLLVAPPALLRERLHLALDPPAALPKLSLGFLLGPPLLRGALVLAPELLPRPLPLLLAALRPAPARGEPDRQQQDHDHRHHYDYDQRRSVHNSSSIRSSRSHHYPGCDPLKAARKA